LQVKEINAVDNAYDQHRSYVQGKYNTDNYCQEWWGVACKTNYRLQYLSILLLLECEPVF
jgi:hypothetical protein